MSQYIKVRGEVLGGHYLPDLGMTIPYKKEVDLESLQASSSRDLMDACRLGYVIRVRGSYSKPKAAPRPSQAPSRSDVSVIPSEPKPSVKVQVTADSQEFAQLRQMHKDLLMAHQTLLTKIDSMLDLSVPTMTYTQSVPEIPMLAEDTVVLSEPDEWGDEEDIVFVPSKIRNTTVQLQGGSPQESQVSTGTGVGDAAARLSAFRGKKPKK